MKTFAELLDEISERESDAAYNMRMRKTARTLKRSAKKGKRKKRLNKLKRKTDQQLQTAARNQAKREVVPGVQGMKPSEKRRKLEKKAAMIDRKTKLIKRILKKAEPERIKAARAARSNRNKK